MGEKMEQDLKYIKDGLVDLYNNLALLEMKTNPNNVQNLYSNFVNIKELINKTNNLLEMLENTKNNK